MRAFIDLPEAGSAFVKRDTIKVVIRGAVKTPGLYVLRNGSRFQDLVRECGGLVRFSDRKRVAWDRRLADGFEYYVPFRKCKKGERIDINRAGAEELCMVPELSPALAREIVRYRERYERFDEMEELKDVEGIGEKTYGRIREFITLGE